MSEPVAWRVLGEDGWYELFDKLGDARMNSYGEEPEPLHTAAEIERKDAAIAELVEALKLYQKIGLGNSTDFELQAEANAAGRAAIAKYDIPKEGI